MKPLLDSYVPFFSRRSMAATAHGSSIYFFGGVGAAGTESIMDVSADLWCFDTATFLWRQISELPVWPSPRRCVGWISSGDNLVLWGGSGINDEQDGTLIYSFLNDEWIFDVRKKTWKLMKSTDDHRISPVNSGSPFPRYTPVFQRVGSDQFLFGGYTEDRLGKRKLNDTWVRSNEIWTRIPPSLHQGYRSGADYPGLRYGSMSAADLDSVYVCGGFSDDGDHNDLWCFDMEQCQWRQLEPEGDADNLPEARYCAAFAYYDHKLYLFGGRSRRFPKKNFNDLWVYDLIAAEWVRLSGNRSPHCYDGITDFLAYHAKASTAVVGHFWYIWGGEGINGHVSDFWRFNFENHQWQLIHPARPDDPKFW